VAGRTGSGKVIDRTDLFTVGGTDARTVSSRSLKVLSAGVASLSSTAFASKNASAQEGAAAPAFRGQHKPKPLSFDPSKLKGLSEKLIRSHWENNYGGAVRALNGLEQRLDALAKEKDVPPFVYGPLKREELLRTGSLVLHE
jgi:superoxide dismutase, Fe-Mn family